MNIDLTHYVIAKWGRWHEVKNNYTPCLLLLTRPDDGVTLVGPLRVRVSVQARNSFTLLGTSTVATQARDVFSYVLDIPPGQSWTYPSPAALVQSRVDFASNVRAAIGEARMSAEHANAPTGQPGFTPGAPVTNVATEPGPAEAAEATRLVAWHPWLFGANSGYLVAIRPAAGRDACCDPCAPDPCDPCGHADPCGQCDPCDPCAPRRRECGCGGGGSCHGGCGCGGSCGCGGHADELPCDLAVANRTNLGAFFPSACEPCAPGASIGMPALKGPALIVPPARGGTVRTRYFNGMFITKEDLWTDQNNNRIKHALMNRAMGQGVVWGLNVCLDGDAVCVLPGYAVDCCGNDLVIAAPYRVDASALVRDPAAAKLLGRGGAQRLHLMLEYYECPEDPRPVHGDPCSPETTRCEMARVRETARLRLVPPCEIDDSGPIRDFLASLTQQPTLARPAAGGATYPCGPTYASGGSPSGGGGSTSPAPAPLVPFTVLVEGLDDQGVVGSSHALAPKLTSDPPPTLVEDDVQGTPNRSFIQRVRVTLTANAGFQFLAGSVVKTPAGAITPTQTPNTIQWQDAAPPVHTSAPTTGPIPPDVVYELQGWSMQDASGNRFSSGGTRIDLTMLNPKAWAVTEWGRAHWHQPEPPQLRMILHVEIEPSGVETTGVSRPPERFPCLSEPCDPDGRPRFPVEVPWLHETPGRPGEAADLKVLTLAGLWAATQATGGGTTSASELNQAAWKLFYGDTPMDARFDAVGGFPKLFADWCCTLLYPGPRCECGCETHGVVVGCAMVEGGAIQMVDPWGGRRWVVHYPLLSYWGKEFGIMPLDALASKFFGLICCIAQLVAPRRPTLTHDFDAAGLAGDRFAFDRRDFAAAGGTPGAATINVGAGVLFVARAADVAAQLDRLGVEPARTSTLSPMEFVARVFAATATAAGRPRPGTPMVHYAVLGVPELHFLAPESATAATAPGGGGQPARPAAPPVAPLAPSRPSVPPSPGRLAEIIRGAIAARPARSAVPLLLRDPAVSLTRELLDVMALEPATEAGRAVRDSLTDAGITSVAALLDSHPEDLHVNILDRGNAAGLADLLDVSEKSAVTTAKAVGDTMQKFAADGRLVARDDLARSEVAADFSRTLADALKGALPAEAVSAAVARAAEPTG